MIVAVTGGTGFIGSRLVQRHVERGDEVRLLSRKLLSPAMASGAIVHAGDLLHDEGLQTFVDGADVLYHCAGQITDPALMRPLHVDGTRRLIEAGVGRIGRWVQLSSVGVYGPVLHGEVTEESAPNPVGEYETTKAESDELVLAAAGEGAFGCAVLRPSNVFGAAMSNQSLFGMIRMIERGLFFFIGRPGASANYVHVDNVVEGLLRCATLQQAEGRVFNLSDHRSMERFVAAISEALGCKVPGLRLPELPVRWMAGLLGSLPGFPLTPARVTALSNRSVYPTRRIEQELGYRHGVGMEQGLREMVAAYRSRR